MKLLTIAAILLSSFFTGMADALAAPSLQCNTFDIDSTDIVTINMDLAYIWGNIIEVPVFIKSDEVINTLDFSMLLDTHNLEFLEVITHTGSLQHAAFFNTGDSKLRFTSNSFSPYPVDPDKVVSIRLRVLSGAVFPSDIKMVVGYLNGDPCKANYVFTGEVLPVSSKEIITNEIFITPNPATDELFIQSDTEGTLDMFDAQGRKAISDYSISAGHYNTIDIQTLPRGQYTVRLVTTDDKVKTQKIVLL